MNRRSVWRWPWIGSLVLLAAAPAAAQVPTDVELQMNTYTTGNQLLGTPTRLPNGNFVVVWESEDATGDGDFSVQMRLLDSSGVPLGEQIQVNTYTTGFQRGPDVAALATGDFVVAWQSNGSTGTDTSLYSVQVRRFAADGTPASSEIQVNTYTLGRQRKPTIVGLPSGQFIVAWQSDGSSGDDDDGSSVQARRFSSSGTPVAGEFQVNSYTTGNQGYGSFPAIDLATGTGDGWVATWHSDGSAGTDNDLQSVQARRFSGTDTPLGPDFQVNTFTTTFQSHPMVGSDSTGAFTIVWQSGEAFGIPGPDGDDDGIAARRYTAAGAPSGDEFVVNTFTDSLQRFASVDVGPSGQAVIAWQSNGPDGSNFGIQGRTLAQDGSFASPEFRVNTIVPSSQSYPRVAASDHDFLVVWTSSINGSGTDVDGTAIWARHFDLTLFADGFESGDTSAWSATSP